MNQPHDAVGFPIDLGSLVKNVATGSTGWVEKIRFEIRTRWVREERAYRQHPEVNIVVRLDKTASCVVYKKFNHLVVTGKKALS